MSADAEIVIGAKDQASTVLGKVGGSVSALASGMSALGPVAVGAAAALAQVTAMVVAFNKASEIVLERAKAIDELAKAARAVGESVDGLQAFQFALGEVAGVGAETARQALAELRKSIGEAVQGDQGKIDILAQLGLDAQSLAGAGPVEAFQQIRDSLSQVENAAQRAAIAEKLLGGEARKLMGLLGDQSSAFADSIQAAQDLGITISEDNAIAVEAMNDALGRASAVMEGIVTQVTAELAPAVEGLAVAFVEVVGPLASAANDYLPTLIEDVTYLTGLAIDLGKAFTFQGIDNQAEKMLQDLYDRRRRNDEEARRRQVERIAQSREVAKAEEPAVEAEEAKATAGQRTLEALQKQLDILRLGREEYERQAQLATATTDEERQRIAAIQEQIARRERLAEIDQQIADQQARDEERQRQEANAPSGITATQGRLITRGNAGTEQQRIAKATEKSLEELQSIRGYLADQTKNDRVELVVVGGGA